MINTIGTIAAGIFLLALSSIPGPVLAADKMIAAPKSGDPIVIYTHRFKPEDFEAGKNLIIHGFSEAMEGHDDDRLTFFMVDDDASEVIAVSIFINGASVDEWHEAMGRHEVLKKLEPLRRQPLIRQELSLEKVHVDQ